MSFVRDGSAGITTCFILSPWKYIVGGAAAVTTLVLLSKTLAGIPTRKNHIPLPPGPPAVWFWEDPMPNHSVAIETAKLIEKYGPVVSFRHGNQVTVVIGRMDAATEILEKQGSMLVDRPRSVAVGEILSGGMHLVIQHVGDRLRRSRRAVHAHLQLKAAKNYENIQTGAAKEVILDILNVPKEHIQHAERFATAVVLRIMYGKATPTSNDDPEVVRVKQSIANFQIAYSQTYLVDYFPWLRYLPGYCRQLKEAQKFELALYRDQLSRVKQDMVRVCSYP
ncbi:cytochrome P450 [Chiua virens]|nr:cytochrome P450 [Chiua virens]